MAQGELTVHVARELSRQLEGRGFDVLYDHGQTGADPADQLGQTVSWFGTEYRSDVLLAFLDIAVVQQGTEKVYTLIEIEDGTDRPKVLIGDVLATLLGDWVTFAGRRHLQVGPWTTLIVLAYSQKESRPERVAFLEKRLNQLKTRLTTPNAAVRAIVMDVFRDEQELENKLKQQVEAIIGAMQSQHTAGTAKSRAGDKARRA